MFKHRSLHVMKIVRDYETVKRFVTVEAVDVVEFTPPYVLLRPGNILDDDERRVV